MELGEEASNFSCRLPLLEIETFVDCINYDKRFRQNFNGKDGPLWGGVLAAWLLFFSRSVFDRNDLFAITMLLSEALRADEVTYVRIISIHRRHTNKPIAQFQISHSAPRNEHSNAGI